MPQPFACLDGLVRLSHKEGVDIRRPLLRVLTDLYVQEPSHTREEEQQYIELTLRLLPDVDPATRTAMASKLADYPAAPPAVVEALKDAAPELAALWHERQAPPSVPALTRRQDNSPPTTRRAPIRTASLGEIFLQSPPRDRAALLASLGPAERAGTIAALNLPVRPGARKRLEHAALHRDRPGFAREIQLALGIPQRIALRIAEDDSGELIVTATKALDMDVDVLVRILLILNPAIGESVERVFALVRLNEGLSPDAVAPIVAGWREEADARKSGRYLSMHAPETATASAAARETARGSPEEPARRPAESQPRRKASGGQPDSS